MMILGCKVNDYEATYVRENMNQYYEEVDFKEKADICLIFTCCVTNTAEAKTRKFIHAARRNNPDGFIVAVGCLSQVRHDSEVFEDVDLIIGSDQKDQIVDLIRRNEKGNKVNETISAEFEDLYIRSYPTKSRSFLKIQDGCNQFCSYCVIPYSRGRERSADHKRIFEEARQLSKTNKEIVLTGIHTGRYNDGEYDLYKLLKDLVEIETLETIRLSSIEITEISDEIIDLMANNEKLAAHLHIPVQSCSNAILKAMHRPYTIEEYIKRITYIRSRIPGISISTDLIVGFPGEIEELFEETLQNLKKICFSFIHVFPYSRKSKTLADQMDGHIDPKVKKQRVKDVMELQKGITLNYRSSFIGKTVKVLIEKIEEGRSYGYCRQYIYININQVLNVGELYDVIIDAVNEEEVSGHVAV